jgi:hydrogenase assembly chaperone HypC/HupF
MCIAFPGLVVAVDSFGAVVETEGRRRRASTLFLPDIGVGDWVTVAAGTIVERLEPEHAAEIQAALRTAIALEMGDRSAAGATDQAEGASDVQSF